MSCFSFLCGGAKAKPKGAFKVCVVGGAGGIGQPLSLLLASNPLVSELAVIDLNIAMVPAEGVCADLSHIEGKCKVMSTTLTLNVDKAVDKAGEALTGCKLVMIPAGMPRKPGQERKDLIGINCDIALATVEACAKYCPDAVLGLIVNPVNSVVPAMCNLWMTHGCRDCKCGNAFAYDSNDCRKCGEKRPPAKLDHRKIVGVSTLDCVRANKFVQEITGKPAEIPVIGGHAGPSILPLFSHCPELSNYLEPDKIAELDKRVQNAGTEVVNAKNGKGSATLSMAYSGARLANAVLSGLAGVPATECAYVYWPQREEGIPPYFATKVTFGKNGIEKVHPVGHLSPHEKKRMGEMLPALKEDINDGLSWTKDKKFNC